MAKKKTIAAVLKEAAKQKGKVEKARVLKENESNALKWILMCTYDKARVEFLLPDTAPPYKASDVVDNEGTIHREIRKLPYFVKGQKGPDMKQYRREFLFTSMLEKVHPDDAEVLVNMIKQKPIDGIDKGAINEAFPGTVVDQRTKKT